MLYNKIIMRTLQTLIRLKLHLAQAYMEMTRIRVFNGLLNILGVLRDILKAYRVQSHVIFNKVRPTMCV